MLDVSTTNTSYASVEREGRDMTPVPRSDEESSGTDHRSRRSRLQRHNTTETEATSVSAATNSADPAVAGQRSVGSTGGSPAQVRRRRGRGSRATTTTAAAATATTATAMNSGGRSGGGSGRDTLQQSVGTSSTGGGAGAKDLEVFNETTQLKTTGTARLMENKRELVDVTGLPNMVSEYIRFKARRLLVLFAASAAGHAAVTLLIALLLSLLVPNTLMQARHAQEQQQQQHQQQLEGGAAWAPASFGRLLYHVWMTSAVGSSDSGLVLNPTTAAPLGALLLSVTTLAEGCVRGGGQLDIQLDTHSDTYTLRHIHAQTHTHTHTHTHMYAAHALTLRHCHVFR